MTSSIGLYSSSLRAASRANLSKSKRSSQQPRPIGKGQHGPSREAPLCNLPLAAVLARVLELDGRDLAAGPLGRGPRRIGRVDKVYAQPRRQYRSTG